MKGEWCYFKSKFSKEECEWIINEGLKIPDKNATIGKDGLDLVDDSVRRSKVRFIHKESKFEGLFDEIWKMAIQANDEWFNFHITRIPFMQLAEYDSSYQGEYKKHHDVFWLNNDPIYHRKLSCVVQLSHPSDYQGGNFEIWNEQQKPNPEEIRQQGTTIFIPSFLEHQLTPVTRGKRYSLAIWFEGPKWR